MQPKYIVILVIIIILALIFAIPLAAVGLFYAVTIPIAWIYAFNAEAWLDMHGTKYSAFRAFKYGFMGPFYIHNYYHQAFRTYSLDIFDTGNVMFREQLPDAEILKNEAF